MCNFLVRHLGHGIAMIYASLDFEHVLRPRIVSHTLHRCHGSSLAPNLDGCGIGIYASDLPGLLLVCYLTLSGFTQDTHTSSTSEIILSLPSCLPSQSSWGFCLRLHVLSLPRQSAVVFSRMIVIINRLATHACYLGSTRSVLVLLEPAREFMLVKDQSL